VGMIEIEWTARGPKVLLKVLDSRGVERIQKQFGFDVQ
jgi:hypothetical protein